MTTSCSLSWWLLFELTTRRDKPEPVRAVEKKRDMFECMCVTVIESKFIPACLHKPPQNPTMPPLPPSSTIRAVSFCKPLRLCCQASFCEVAPAIKQQWREWLIQQWGWQYSSASIWRQPAGLEPFQTALCFSSEEKSIHNWWQFKERLYCGISNKTSENTEKGSGRGIEWKSACEWLSVCVCERREDRKCDLHFALSPFCTWMVMKWLRGERRDFARVVFSMWMSTVSMTQLHFMMPRKTPCRYRERGDCVQMKITLIGL